MHVPYSPGDAGIICIAKPAGYTSHDIVGKIRRIYKTKKVGHAGTLDPAATGMLIIGIGRATKLLGYLALTEKTYITTIRLGAATLSDDAESDIISQCAPEQLNIIDDSAILAASSTFLGEIMQKPSRISAIKIAGQRAYDRVRSGQEVDIPARKVHIYQFDIDAILRNEHGIDCHATVSCSSGTYIRALARDLGEKLGIYGHVRALHRTRVGIFDRAHQLAELEEQPILDMSLEQVAIHMYSHRIITHDQERDLYYGRKIPPGDIAGIYTAITEDRRAIALMQDKEGYAQSELLLNPLG